MKMLKNLRWFQLLAITLECTAKRLMHAAGESWCYR
jgi:hypothetical protein